MLTMYQCQITCACLRRLTSSLSQMFKNLKQSTLLEEFNTLCSLTQAYSQLHNILTSQTTLRRNLDMQTNYLAFWFLLAINITMGTSWKQQRKTWAKCQYPMQWPWHVFSFNGVANTR